MRLLRVDSVDAITSPDGSTFGFHCERMRFEEFLGEKPNYVIASHRWSREELTFDDIVHGTGKEKAGWEKLMKFCRAVQALGREPPIDYIWIDTCCIDKTNSTELSEALNSMYRWYSEAAVCLAYLHDVPGLRRTDPDDLLYSFKRSEWFTRGWTLQELLAPSRVVFYTGAWEPIGYKATTQWTKLGCPVSAVGLPMNQWVSEVTGIPETVLWNISLAEHLTFEERQSWMKGRKTTRVEDMAYCQLGLYGVFLSPIYGEREEAYERLLEAIERRKLRRKLVNPESANLSRSTAPPYTFNKFSYGRKYEDDEEYATPDGYRTELRPPPESGRPDLTRNITRDPPSPRGRRNIEK